MGLLRTWYNCYKGLVTFSDVESTLSTAAPHAVTVKPHPYICFVKKHANREIVRS